MAVVHSYPLLLALAVIAGGLTATVSVGSGRALMAWFGPAERGLALGLRQMSIPAGGALAALTLPFLLAHAQLPQIFVILGGVWALPTVAILVWLGPAPLALGPTARPRGSPLGDRRLWLLALSASLVVFGQISMIGYLVLFLAGVRHLPLQVAATAMLFAQLGAATTRVGLGRISDGIRSRTRPLRWVAATSALFFAASAPPRRRRSCCWRPCW
jgi:sugar phosphate permease